MRPPHPLLQVAACGLLPLLAACVVTVGGSSCSMTSIQGSGIEATQAREVPSFTKVHLSGSGEVRAAVGASQQPLRVTCDDNLLQYVTTEVRGDTLHIGMQPGSYSFRRDLVVELSAPVLEAVSISGSGSADVDGVSGGTFVATISGSGDVTARGSVERLSVSVSGSGSMELAGLRARTAQVQISGSGDVRIDVSEDLNVQVSGSGDVRYSGNPRVLSNISGSGSVSGT
jgi:hypothetical protein